MVSWHLTSSDLSVFLSQALISSLVFDGDLRRSIMYELCIVQPLKVPTRKL